MTRHQRKISVIVNFLLDWFAQNARDLPWRRTRDPYAIWVSEIMLQQTQVKTVIPFWERWLRELPTIQSLARATPAKIHKLWEGLGYYTRVRNLQKAAQQIIAQHHGQFPRDFAATLELPGIGRYTAGAISSIAFNEPQPILDGNVIRVLTRIFGITENPREKSTNQKLWHLAKQFVTATNFKSSPSPLNGDHVARSAGQLSGNTLVAGLGSHWAGVRSVRARSQQHNTCSHLNQSLMELGALICTPKQPKCPLCPVQKLCVAYRTNRVEQLPNLGSRAAATSRRFATFVIQHRGCYLVRQRPAGVVNAHLWEFPNIETAAVNSELQKLAATELGFKITSFEKLCTLKHSITRYRITLEAYSTVAASPPSAAKSSTEARWLTLRQLDTLAFTSAHRKILKQLSE